MPKIIEEKPTSFRLGKLKAPLQRIAMELDRSLHWVVLDILKKDLERRNEIKNKK